MTLLTQWLVDAAQAWPAKPAAEFCDAQGPAAAITFGELHAESDALARALQGRGLGPGARVAVLHGNARAALVWFWGVLKAGAIHVDVPLLAAPDVIQAIVDEARPAAIVMDESAAAKLGTQLTGTWQVFVSQPVVALPTAVTLETLLSEVPGPASPAVQVVPDDVALVVYTSGTTGQPSGVMLTHRNFVTNLEDSNALMHLGPGERILVVVPLYYIHGRMQMLLHAMLGGTLVFSAGFQFPSSVLREMHARKVTAFSGVPYHFRQLLTRSKLAEQPPPTLRYVLVTGGALEVAELDALQTALPDVDVHIAYGQTEAAPRITWLGPADRVRKAGSVGIALPRVQLEILGAGDHPLPRGEAGEVVAGGPNIMPEYVGGTAHASGRLDAKGRLRTGDLGYVDDDGFLFLVGRSSDMIKTAGERVFPGEIERVLAEHAAVVECAVIGVPDATLGERIVAFVVLQAESAVDVAALKGHCLASLPFVRVPKAFHIVPELPKTGSGKVRRAELVSLVPSTTQPERT